MAGIVDGDDFCDHPVDGKAFGEAEASGVPHRGSQVGIAEERFEAIGEGERIAWGHEVTGDAVGYLFE